MGYRNSWQQKGFTLIITLVKRIIFVAVTVIPLIFLSNFIARAHALPANFPNLNDYQAVNVEKYTQHYFNGDMASFKIANGTRCGFDFGEVIFCLGHFYHSPELDSNLTGGACLLISLDKILRYDPIVYNDKPATITVDNAQEDCRYADRVILPVGYKITFKGNTCAAGKGNMVACTNGRFGFIISDNQAQVF